MSEERGEKFRFAIDRGGTFTDVYAETPGSSPNFRVLKLLSVDPTNYRDAPCEGIRRILEQVTGIPHPKGKPIDTSRIESIRMGTTVATNALLERNGTRCALLVTKGFKDILHIGNQSRPNIFDLKIKIGQNLYENVIEIDERVLLRNTEKGDISAIETRKAKRQKTNSTLNNNYNDNDNEENQVVKGTTGQELVIVKPLDEEEVRQKLQSLLNNGITSIAIAFMHSYTFEEHEKKVGEIAVKMGFKQISLSCETTKMQRIVPRGSTTVADAYLTPCIQIYLENFVSGFDDKFNERVELLFMQSDGGLTSIKTFTGSKAILSGPAGGVVGCSRTSYDNNPHNKEKRPIIGFDMGGTSTDVSRYGGSLEHVFETRTAGIFIQAPQLDINTVAAGGGSRLFYRSGMFVVGPESVGAHPGPVCYRKEGGINLAITDANLQLGRLLPEYFPKIFGPTENLPLDAERTNLHFQKLAKEINEFQKKRAEERGEKIPLELSVDEIAYGFITIANEAMCRPIRSLTQMKGYDSTTHILGCFGGAGAQHACAIAYSLGIKEIYIHKFSGILSAYGLALANVVQEEREPAAAGLDNVDQMKDIYERLERLSQTAIDKLKQQKFSKNSIKIQYFMNLRYEGTDKGIFVACPPEFEDKKNFDFGKVFIETHFREFGFSLKRRILVDDIRVRAVGLTNISESQKLKQSNSTPIPLQITSTYFKGGRFQTPVYNLENLLGGDKINGPSIIIDKNCTIVIEPNWIAHITEEGDVRIVYDKEKEDIEMNNNNNNNKEEEEEEGVDPVQLSIFAHRFMGIAEQMGKTLQRVAVSVNIKERLDFSCALFDCDGGLVANAPHIPVHLGSMQEAVRFQVRNWGSNLKDGDVIVSNHPQLAGGSHLPDITVITPVFRNGKPVFFVASRGHHADIGGITPGSIPPFSKFLNEEGAAIIGFKIVENGVFKEKEISDILTTPAGPDPRIVGTRNLVDNISDLKAQIAANQKGINLMGDLIDQFSIDVVQTYMKRIQTHAEIAVREMLIKFANNPENEKFNESEDKNNFFKTKTIDSMDDGTDIVLTIDINKNNGNTHFDFTGTGPEVYGNCNAPESVTYSATIYCLRCLVGQDIPLNQGCLTPCHFTIPKGSIISPSPEAAVVGGNVLTSQRLTDVILLSFKAAACSQGCVNNLTFGNDNFGYYETIAGGAGAGSGWEGRSGVHTHMTNTRITDPEILEQRYPVILKKFSLRTGSAGNGRFKGGEGVIREIEFRTKLTVGILSERRSLPPKGLCGGGDGGRGKNLLIKKDGRVISLGGKASVDVETGEAIQIHTPGGGGYGEPN